MQAYIDNVEARDQLIKPLHSARQLERRAEVLAVILRGSFDLRDLPREDRWMYSDREIVKTAMFWNPCCFRAARGEAAFDHELALEAINWDFDNLKWVHEALRADPAFLLKACRFNWQCLLHAAPVVTRDPEFMCAVFRQEPRAEGLQNPGRALQYASPELRASRNVVLAAVKHGGDALQYASCELRADREVALAAIAHTSTAFLHASDALKADYDVVHAAVSQHGWLIWSAAPAMKADVRLALVAVKSAGRAALVKLPLPLRDDAYLHRLCTPYSWKRRNGRRLRVFMNVLRDMRDAEVGKQVDLFLMDPTKNGGKGHWLDACNRPFKRRKRLRAALEPAE